MEYTVELAYHCFDYHHHRFCDGGLSEQEAGVLYQQAEGITIVTMRGRSKERLANQLSPLILIMSTIILTIMV